MTDQPWTCERYAVVDVEGNGQRPPDLVELAIVPIVEGEIGSLDVWLIKPDTPITAMARRIHGISNEMVANAPAFIEVETDVRAALAACVIVAHNAAWTSAFSDVRCPISNRSRSSTPSSLPGVCCRIRRIIGSPHSSTRSGLLGTCQATLSLIERPTTP